MNFGADTWWIVAGAVTIAISIIGFFLKRTMNTQDEHERAIKEIREKYATNEKLTEVRNGLSENVKKTQLDIEDIKERMLTKQDYYRLQTQTEQKIDKIYDLLLKYHGGGHENG